MKVGTSTVLAFDSREARSPHAAVPLEVETSASVQFVPRTDHIPVLDGLRGIAVLLVLWSHLEAVTAHTPLRFVDYVLQPGYLGVDIFFVLSGFLITRILLSNRARRRPVKNFLIRRFLRIFPIYYLTVLVVGFWHPGAYVWWCAVYLSNFYLPFNPRPVPLGHTWSLAVEEHFYLVWPWVVQKLSWRTSRAVALWGVLPVAVIAASIALAVGPRVTMGRFIYMGTIFRASSLALGALFAFHEGWLRANTRNCWRVFGWMLLPALIILPLGEFVFEGLIPLTKMVGFSILCSAILSAALALRDASTWPARVLRSAALTFVGRISYGLYLYHAPIFNAFGLVRHGYAAAHTGAFAVLATFVVATVSFYAFEQPLLRLKERFQ